MMTILILGLLIIVAIALIRNHVSHSEWFTNLSDEDIRVLAQQGKRIAAIKAYRALHGAGLKEAKEAVDRMM